jgi:hypothetical protein
MVWNNVSTRNLLYIEADCLDPAHWVTAEVFNEMSKYQMLQET